MSEQDSSYQQVEIPGFSETRLNDHRLGPRVTANIAWRSATLDGSQFLCPATFIVVSGVP